MTPDARPARSQLRKDAEETERRWLAGQADPFPTWRTQYRAELENEGRDWTTDVIKETSECACHPDRTWLRHVPTGVLVHHDGRSEAGTLAHLADVLGSHKLLTEAERKAAHLPGCDCGPSAHPAVPD